TGLTIFVTLIGCSLSFYNAVQYKYVSRVQATATAIDTHLVTHVYAALKKAQETKGKATVILAHTIKGYGMGDTAEGKNIAHQVK
ncbi:hypothetical protein MJM04_34500, partial [Salmonella enterica subsp. enterica serovar Cerro]|nr:hypothetical protein [Salmonella enterica subsp. enterica serovar Cerro]